MDDKEIIETLMRAEYADWIKDMIRNLVEMSAKKICVCAINEEEEVLTGYWKCSPTDKAGFAHNISSDALLQVLEANGIKLNNEEDEEDEEDEQQ